MKPLRICIVTHLYPVSADDYKGSFVHRIAARLVKRGHTVHVVTPRRPGGARREKRDGVTIHRHWWWGWWRGRQLGELKGTPPLMMSSLLLCGTARTVSIVLGHRLNLLYAYWVVPGGFIAWLAGRLTRRPAVATAAGSDLNAAAQRRLVRPFIRVTLRGIDRLIAAGSDMLRLAEAMGLPQGRGVVLASLLDEPPHCDSKGETVPLPGEPGQRLIYVGNLTPPKRVDTLLRAFALVAPEFPAAHFTIVGEGERRADLEQLAAELNLASQVSFQGRRRHEDVLALLAKSDLFLHCSDNEGLPVAIHEALAAGLPVIAAKVGGIPDLVREYHAGYLHDPNDAESFAVSIKTLISDPTTRERFSANARAFAREQFEQSAMIDRWEEVLYAAANARAGR